MTTKMPAAKKGFAKVAVSFFADSFVVNQTIVTESTFVIKTASSQSPKKLIS
jgi:hypothetical protein